MVTVPERAAAPLVKLYDLGVPAIGNAADVRLTLVGIAAKEPSEMPTTGVEARSCATTKYCILSPAATPPLIRDKSNAKLYGDAVEEVCTNFHPSVELSFVVPRVLEFVDFL
jgi:hypothetical protein